MEAADEQVVPAPPDFSVSPSPSVLLDRVCKALNMDVPKTVSYASLQNLVIALRVHLGIGDKLTSFSFRVKQVMLMSNDFLPQGNSKQKLNRISALLTREQIMLNQLSLNQTGVRQMQRWK